MPFQECHKEALPVLASENHTNNDANDDRYGDQNHYDNDDDEATVPFEPR